MTSNLTSKSRVFRFSFEDNICIIDMNDESSAVNSFTMEMLQDFDDNLPKILAQKDLAGVIITSSKNNCFAAGADISIFDTLKTKEDGERASKELHRLFNYFSEAKVVTVAAIHGVCLGGGLELALACDYRIASSHNSTQMGLPEVKLGILPGGGGTQRLPRLIGIAPALDLILTGKKIDSKKAQKLGLIDKVVPENQLLDKAISLCQSKKGEKRNVVSSIGMFDSGDAPFDVQKFLLEKNPIGRFIIEKQSKKMVLKNTKGKYPAPLLALEAVMSGVEMTLAGGLNLEAKLFGELVVSLESKSLIHIFNMMTSAKKNPFTKDTQNKSNELYINPIQMGSSSVGILGAGLMGSGIATVLADNEVRSVIIDRDTAGLQRGLQSVANYFQDRFTKRRVKWFERDTKTNHVLPSLHFNSLKNSPIVIEAVFEDLKIKQEVLKKCEENCQNQNFIFATNTSSIPISSISELAKNPENVIGMHFFSPVPKMPLVEIIKTPKTSDVVTSAVFDVASKMGKQIIIVNDGPGFFTTRILAFQVAEALNILSEGARIEDIDSALEEFGMPVGPVTLLDEVGIDVGEHIVRVLMKSFSDRIIIPKEIDEFNLDQRKGRKNNKGFYLYNDGKKGGPDESIYKHFTKPRINFDKQLIVDRCIYVFLNEAARCLEENIIQSEDDGDLGAIFGLGFPPFLGGPFHYGKRIGKTFVKNKLTELAQKYGKRFEPVKYWNS